MSGPEPGLRPTAPYPSSASPPSPPGLSPGACCSPGQSWPSLCPSQAPPTLLPAHCSRQGSALRSFVHNAGDRTSPSWFETGVVFFYFILLFLLIFNLNLLTRTPPQLRGPLGSRAQPHVVSPMGLGVCPALWGSFQNSPQPIRTPQPQSQASPLAWSSKASGLSSLGLLPPSV